jgi:hypothetical protein
LHRAVSGRRRDLADYRCGSEARRARVGLTAVLYTWSSTLTHHPHFHRIAPGCGVARRGTLGRLPGGTLRAGEGARKALSAALSGVPARPGMRLPAPL